MQFRGKVHKGKQRGKRLGFPTANIPLSHQFPEGIYISIVTHLGVRYKALTFIGAAKTFRETIYQSETYIFDFDNDIYDEELDVTLLEKIRDNEMFTTEEELIKKMENDKKKATEYFRKNPL